MHLGVTGGYGIKNKKTWGLWWLSTVDPLVKGEWETRDAKLIPYQTHIKELVKQFDEVTFDHIPHEDNQLADALATLSSMFALSKDEDMPLIRIQHQD